MFTSLMGGADNCVSAAAAAAADFASESAPKSMLGRIWMSKLRLRAVLVMHMVLVIDIMIDSVAAWIKEAACLIIIVEEFSSTFL